MNFGQLLTAMVTPFDQDGEIDFQATERLIENLLATGTDGLVIAGTTGESPTMTTEEKISLFQFTVKMVNGRVPVIAGTGSNSTRASINLTQIAEASGVDGIMLVTPYYNRPSQEGLYQHFKAIANCTSLPVMLYNVPGRCSVNMEVNTVVRLSQIANIVCVKEASEDLESMAQIIEQTNDDFLLYSGDDSLTLPVLAIGGQGVVSVAAHILGTEMKEMIVAYQNGHSQEAESIHRDLLPVMKALFSAPSPTPIKAALGMSGLPVGSVRLPLVPLSQDESEALHAVIRQKLSTVAVS